MVRLRVFSDKDIWPKAHFLKVLSGDLHDPMHTCENEQSSDPGVVSGVSVTLKAFS